MIEHHDLAPSPDGSPTAETERRGDEALRWIMADRRGRAFLWDLMARSNWLVSRLAHATARDGSRLGCDPHLTAWNDGRAEAGNYLFATIMRVCPERFAAMQQEAAAQAATALHDQANNSRSDGERHDRPSNEE